MALKDPIDVSRGSELNIFHRLIHINTVVIIQVAKASKVSSCYTRSFLSMKH
jgi:hypothetical protein